MTEPSGTNMICPKCGQFQEKADICNSCGVVIAKVRQEPVVSPTVTGAPDPGPESAPEPGIPETIPELPMAARVAILSFFLLIGAGAVFVSIPREMSLEEFVEAKKSSFHMRGFRIEGIAEPHDSYLVTQTSDGRTLSSLKITRGDTAGYVTYDPEQTEQVPGSGDVVRITGSFDSVPYYDHTGKYKTITIAMATSITVIEQSGKADQ